MITHDQVVESAHFLQSQGVVNAEYGIILGTGLGRLAEEIEAEVIIDYADIPHFPLSTVETHKGKLLFGQLSGKKVVALQGRFHVYEGYRLDQITLPVRVMKLLGIKGLLVSNAAGNMNMNWKKGDLMLIEDHIDHLPGNPLTGKNMDEMGPRFPDMSQPYNAKLNTHLLAIAKKQDIVLRKGVYVAVSGPNLETRAEYRMLRVLGADAVGMSTVPENIVANHISLPFCAISVLTDDCDPDNLKPVNIADIIETAGKAEAKLSVLFKQLLFEL